MYRLMHNLAVELVLTENEQEDECQIDVVAVCLGHTVTATVQHSQYWHNLHPIIIIPHKMKNTQHMYVYSSMFQCFKITALRLVAAVFKQTTLN